MTHTAKIAISIEAALLKQLDHYIADHIFKNRSQAIQTAVANIIENLAHQCLATECAKLDANEEQAMAEEWLDGESKLW